jgi:hypothetical protein
MSMTDEEMKQKILDHLAQVPGKGVEVPARIISSLGLKRKEVMKLLSELSGEGKIEVAGAAAGVVGYKLKK